MEQQAQICHRCRKNQTTPPNILCDECYSLVAQPSAPPINSPKVEREHDEKDTAHTEDVKMFCPQCGYVIGPFDVECTKCKQIAEGTWDTVQARRETRLKEAAIYKQRMIMGSVALLVFILFTYMVLEEGLKAPAREAAREAAQLAWDQGAPAREEARRAAAWNNPRDKFRRDAEAIVAPLPGTSFTMNDNLLKLEVRGATRREAKEFADLLGNAFLREIPEETNCIVEVKDYDTLKVIYKDYYFK